jgi:hypothetical protein
MLKVLHRLREKTVIDDDHALSDRADETCDIQLKPGVSRNSATTIGTGDRIVEENEARGTPQRRLSELDFHSEQTFNSNRCNEPTTMSSIISLRGWIESAMQTDHDSCLVNQSFVSSSGPDSSDCSTSIRRSLAVYSDNYLTSALRVARSLANQCCEADEHIGGHQPLLPTPGTDWADRVVVHLSNDHKSIDDYKDDLEPLPFSRQNPSCDLTELQGMLNNFIPDHSLYHRNDAEEGVSISGANEAVPNFFLPRMTNLAPRRMSWIASTI